MSKDYSIHHFQKFNIGDIYFDKKEMDIIGYILDTHTYQDTAFILKKPIQEITSIGESAVKKINGTSIDDISGFFAAPNYKGIMNLYYTETLIEKSIDDFLLTIPIEPSTDTKNYFILDNINSETSCLKKHVMQKMLKKIGINSSFISHEKDIKFPERTIIITDDAHFNKTMHNIDSEEPFFICESIQSSSKNCYPENTSNFYFVVLDIIIDITSNKKIQKLIVNYKKQYKNILFRHDLSSEHYKIRDKSFREAKTNRMTVIFYITILSIIAISIYFYENFYLIRTELENINTKLINQPLPRLNLQSTINRTINNQPKLKTRYVVISGAGGCGKTSIVKVYVKGQMGRIKWLINAETEGTLMNSLMDFAHNLSCLTKTSQKLSIIKNTKDISVKKTQLFKYVLQHLKRIGKYHLIFDNADNIDLVMKFFPKNRNDLGLGTIYFTLRHFPNNKNLYFKRYELVDVCNLTHQEQIKLFSSVLYNNSVINLLEYKRISNFLKHLLPYPLDILSAAHYIKNTSISFDAYLKRMYRLRASFNNIQNTLSDPSNDYHQTRNAIITSSVSSLIKQHLSFKQFLLPLTLLDSQDIPTEILYLKHSDETVDKFIYHLKEHYIGTVKNYKIYMHRSIQSISKQFLIENMDYQSIKNIIFTLVDTLKILNEKYTIDKNKRVSLQLKVHTKALLQNIEKLLKPKDIKMLLPTIYLIIAKINFNDSANYISAVKYYNLAIEHNTKSNTLSFYDTAEAEQNLGWIRLYWNQYAKAEENINKSLKISENRKECKNIIITNIRNLGKCAGIKGDFKQSMKYLNKALSLTKDSKNANIANLKAGIYNQIASSYLRNCVTQKHKYEESICLLEKSLELSNASDMFSLIKYPDLGKVGSWAPSSRWRLAQNYYMLNKYEEAIDHLKESNFLTDNLPNYKYKVLQRLLNLRELAKIKLRQGKLKESLTLFTKAIRLTKNSNIGMDTWKSQIYRAEVLMRLKKYKLALVESLSVVNHTHGQNNFSFLLHNYNLLNTAILYNCFGNIKESKKMLKKFFNESHLLVKNFILTNTIVKSFDKNLLTFDENETAQKSINKGILLLESLIGKNHDIIKNHLSLFFVRDEEKIN